MIDGFPVDVYINDDFHGVYTWNIPKSAWMFSMDEDNPNHIVMCGENWEPAALLHAEPNLESWSIEVGPENDETLKKFSRLTDFIMNSSDAEFKEHFGEYLDLDATLNYAVLVDFAFLTGNCAKNMLMVTYDGELWYPSLYDLDTSWGTLYNGLELWDYENNFAGFNYNILGHRLETVFAQELHDRYFELHEELLTKEHVMELFHAFNDRFSKISLFRDTRRWGQPGYDFSQIEAYLDTIIVRLDQKYENLIQ